QEISRGMWAGTVVVALVFAVVLFFLIPVGLTSLVKHQLGSSLLFWLVEGAIRTSIFLGYLLLLSRVRDLRRVFEYHGAEHKVIACFEASDELVPERAKLYSRLHPRCGTSFLLIVMIMAIFVFAPIGLPAWWLLVLTRVLGVPLIAGLSFEVIKWAGRNRRKHWVQAIMYPGLQLQRLTTREPDLEQLVSRARTRRSPGYRVSPRGRRSRGSQRAARRGRRRSRAAVVTGVLPPADRIAGGGDPPGDGRARPQRLEERDHRDPAGGGG